METALVLVLDDAETFDEVRREFDPDTVARGIPFHLTLLYPFAPRQELTEDVLAETRSFFAARRPLAFALTRIASWPEVVYAVPEPDAELRDCMQALHALFPQWPPYGGVYDTVNPHATLVESVASADVYPGIEQRLRDHLPVQWTADAVTLLEEFAPDRWRELERIPFGG